MYQSKGVNFKDGKLRTIAGSKPLNHIGTRLPKKVKRKKTLYFLKWLILFVSLTSNKCD